jgi:hypothetical protein
MDMMAKKKTDASGVDVESIDTFPKLIEKLLKRERDLLRDAADDACVTDTRTWLIAQAEGIAEVRELLEVLRGDSYVIGC